LLAALQMRLEYDSGIAEKPGQKDLPTNAFELRSRRLVFCLRQIQEGADHGWGRGADPVDGTVILIPEELGGDPEPEGAERGGEIVAGQPSHVAFILKKEPIAEAGTDYVVSHRRYSLFEASCIASR